MPLAVKGTPAEREQFMYEVFRDFYSNPKNSGRELSVDRANKEHIRKFGSMLRNKKAYAIRNSVKAQLGAVGKVRAGQAPRVLSRTEGQLVDAVRHGAVLIEGSPEQIGWLTAAGLEQLGWKVDHSTSAYAVLVRSS